MSFGGLRMLKSPKFTKKGVYATDSPVNMGPPNKMVPGWPVLSFTIHYVVRTTGCDLLYYRASVAESVACVHYEGADLVPCHGRCHLHTDHPLFALLHRVKQKLPNCLWMLQCTMKTYKTKI